MKKAHLLILFLIILFCLVNISCGKEDYNSILRKFEKGLLGVNSYRIESESLYDRGRVIVEIDFVRPGIQRQTIISPTTREVNLYVKNKHYILVPGTTKWAEQRWEIGAEPVKDLGELNNILEMMKKEKPTEIDRRNIEDSEYITLTYKDIPDWGNVHRAFQDYKSNIRLYIESNTYLLKLAIIEMYGSQIRSGKGLNIRQTSRFSSYNEDLGIGPPGPDDIFVHEPPSEELPTEIFRTETKEFKNSEQGVRLAYPAAWHIKEYANPGIYQLFISKEKVEKPGDIYLTGVSVTKIYSAKEKIGLKSQEPAAVADEYLKKYIQSIRTSESVVIISANTPVEVGKDTGYKSELTFKDRYGRLLTISLVILYKDDTFTTITMESTQQEFNKYRKVFTDILLRMSVF